MLTFFQRPELLLTPDMLEVAYIEREIEIALMIRRRQRPTRQAASLKGWHTRRRGEA